MYKDYKFKAKMIQKHWLELEMKSLWGSNMKITIQSRGNEPLMGGIKIWLWEATAGRYFLVGG